MYMRKRTEGKMRFEYDLTEKVLKEIQNQPAGLKGKIKKYLDLLKGKGPALIWPFVDKIESYKNLWELRPSYGNIEFRMIFFWKQRKALFVRAFTEKGKKKKNQREYRTANNIKKVLEGNI